MGGGGDTGYHNKGTQQALEEVGKKASELDMVSDEFVYIAIETLGLGFASSDMTPFWVDVENGTAVDDAVKEAAMRMLTVDIKNGDVDAAALADFAANAVPRVRADPLYCSTPACLSNDGKSVAAWARHLHDIFYLYALSLNDSLKVDPIGGQANVSLIVKFVIRNFTGNVKIFEDEATSLWLSRDGKRPLTRPICGYSGTECPKSFWDEGIIYVSVGAALVAVLFIAAIAFIIYFIR
ncbi:hypothetical protein KIN20_014419 [Parelaphostrongylus tenuis]|uniref:Uncharacterized protein n=1 Tax=Parelaphostrongylus tenuis TaxID=148309 RepID=A0AAD5QPE5_PARTN|nr:hypothetical protein KIN20_014419 [Parelaphostrongylus tenuis]